MTKRVRIGSRQKSKKPICAENRYTPKIVCVVCGRDFSTASAFADHANKHVKAGEMVKYIVNPKASVYWQKYGYKLVEKK